MTSALKEEGVSIEQIMLGRLHKFYGIKKWEILQTTSMDVPCCRPLAGSPFPLLVRVGRAKGHLRHLTSLSNGNTFLSLLQDQGRAKLEAIKCTESMWEWEIGNLGWNCQLGDDVRRSRKDEERRKS